MLDPRVKAFNEACEKVLSAAVALEEAKKELAFRFQQIPDEDRRSFVREYAAARTLGER